MCKKCLSILLVILFLFILTACDDFTRNVDGVGYDTECYNKTPFNNFTLVRLPDELHEEEEIEEEIVIGEYQGIEYYFSSITVYNYYLVEVQGRDKEYLPILEAIEEDDYTMEFLIDWCEGAIIHDEMESRDSIE